MDALVAAVDTTDEHSPPSPWLDPQDGGCHSSRVLGISLTRREPRDMEGGRQNRMTVALKQTSWEGVPQSGKAVGPYQIRYSSAKVRLPGFVKASQHL